MYIEDQGAGDGDIKITVEGEEYTAEANYDLDHDGVDDTVAVMTDDGFVAYIDQNHDGVADVTQTVNGDGEVVSQARFDPSTGQWHGEQPDQHPQPGPPDDHGGQQMVIDAPDGQHPVGPATEDTDGDGRPDTAVVPTDHGTMLVTDFDGDGSADQVVEVTDTGDVTVRHHAPDGQWEVVQQGKVGQDGSFQPHPPAGPPGAADDKVWTDDRAWSFDRPAPHDPAPVQQAADDARPRPDSDVLWS